MNESLTCDAKVPSFLIYSGSDGARLEMESNCFINNSVSGNALVTLVNEPEGLLKNNFGTLVSGLECQFISVVNGTCIEFDAEVCPLPFEYEMKANSGSANIILSIIRSIALGVLIGIMLSV